MKKKYKILYHHQTLMDGAEAIHILGIYNAFQRLGHLIKMIPPMDSFQSGTERPPARKKNIIVEKLRQMLPLTLFEIIRVFYNFIDLVYLYFKFKKEKPDFIYKRHANYNFAPILAAKYNHIPMILEVNSIYSYKGRLIYEDVKLAPVSCILENFIFRNSSLIIVVSTALKSILVNRKVKGERICVLPNGVDLEKFQLHEEPNKILTEMGGQIHTYIGFVGILRDWHGIGFFLETLRTVDLVQYDCKVIIVGDGEKRSEYENFVSTHNLHHNVIFTGRVQHEEVPKIISGFDICIMPDSNDYGSPMKIIEYMAMKKAVLAPDLIPIRDIITDGKDGILFERGDKQDLSRKITFLLEHPETRATLGYNARKKVEKELNWKRNAEKVLAKFEQSG